MFTLAVLTAMVVAAAPATADEKTSTSHLTLAVGRDADPYAVAFSPDGQSLAVAGVRMNPAGAPPVQSVVSLWDAATGKCKWQQALAAPMATGLTPVFSPDGKLLAVFNGFSECTVALLDVRSGKVHAIVKVGTVAGDFDMAFSAGSKFLAGCGDMPPAPAYALRLWETAGGKLGVDMKRPQPQQSRSSSIDSPEAMLANLAMAGGMSSLQHCPAFSPDGRVVAVATSLQVDLWDVRSGKLRAAVSLLPPLAGGGGQGMGFAVGTGGVVHSLPWPVPLFSPDGKTLVVAAAGMSAANGNANFLGNQAAPLAALGEDPIFVIDVPSGTTRRTVEKFPNRFLALQADGKSVAGCASRGGRLKLALCTLATGQVKSVLDQEVPGKRAVEQIAFSPDGSKLATSERNLVNGTLQYDVYTIHLWETSTGKQLAEFEGRRAKPGARVPQARQGKTPPATLGFGGGPGMMGIQPGGGFGPAAQGEHEASSGMLAPKLRFSPNGAQLALLDTSAGHMTDATLDLWNLADVLSPGDSASASSADAKPPSGEPHGKEKLRMWTSADGRFTVDAELAAVSGDKITLKKKSGDQVEIPLAKLSREDRAYVEGRR